MKRHASALALAIAISGFAAPAAPGAAASRQAADGVVTGIVVAADSGQPVRKADVRLTSTSPRRTLTAVSDGDGRFRFDPVPPGEYSLSGSRPGYVTMVLGARDAGADQRGTPVRVAAGQQVEGVSLALPRAGVIAGIVTDEYGDPAYNVPVRALRFAYQNGHRIVNAAGVGTTNDLGEYRIPHLDPGEYLITAVPRDTVAAAAARAESLRRMQADREAAAAAGDPEARAAVATMAQARREGRMPPPVDPVGYVPVYHPRAVLPATASAVTVGLGGQVFGIDLRLELVRTGVISGTIVNSNGEPIQGNVKLIDPAMPVTSIGAWFTSSTPDGQFAFHGVVPGTYAVSGNNSPPGTLGSPPASGGVFQTSALVEVMLGDADVSGVQVRMQPVSSIAGRIDLSTVSAPFNRDELRINFLPVSTPADWEMAIYRAVPEADGSFLIPNVIAATYRVDVGGVPEGWVVGVATFDGRDTTDTHFVVEPGRAYQGGVVTLTDQVSGIAGAVTNARGEPQSHYAVVLFPQVPELRVPRSRRIRVAHTGPDGRYLLDRMPPGDYRLGVVTDFVPGREFDPDFLEQLAQASLAVTLEPGQTATRDIRVR